MKKFCGVEDSLESGPPIFRDTIYVVEPLGTVDAYADQKVVLFEKLAPFLVQQGSVGLQVVGYFFTRRAVQPFVFYYLFEEIYPE